MAVITKGIELCILGFEIIVKIFLCFMTAILTLVWRGGMQLWYKKNFVIRKFAMIGQNTEKSIQSWDSRAPDHACIQLLWQVLMSHDRVPCLSLEDRGHILRRILLLREWILRALFLLTKEMFSFLFLHSRLKKSIIKITHRSLPEPGSDGNWGWIDWVL